MSFIMSKHLI